MGNTNRPDISDFIKDKQKTAHLIGIGGVSMCSLAETLLESGHKITGSDMQSSSATKSLSRQKVKIYVGHFARERKRGRLYHPLGRHKGRQSRDS